MNHEQYRQHRQHRQKIEQNKAEGEIAELIEHFYYFPFSDELEKSARNRIVGNLLRLNAGLPLKTSISSIIKAMDILFERSVK